MCNNCQHQKYKGGAMILSNYKNTIFYCSIGNIKTMGESYRQAIQKAWLQLTR